MIKGRLVMLLGSNPQPTENTKKKPRLLVTPKKISNFESIYFRYDKSIQMASSHNIDFEPAKFLQTLILQPSD